MANKRSEKRGNLSYTRNNWKQASQEEIEDALKRFLEKRGSIKHLISQYDNPNLNYDSQVDKEWRLVCEIAGFKIQGKMRTDFAASLLKVVTAS